MNTVFTLGEGGGGRAIFLLFSGDIYSRISPR